MNGAKQKSGRRLYSPYIDPNNNNPPSNNSANLNKPNQQQHNEQMLQIIK